MSMEVMRKDMRKNCEAVVRGLAAQGMPPQVGCIVIFFHTGAKISQMAVAMPHDTIEPHRHVAEILKSEAMRAAQQGSDNLVVPATSIPKSPLDN